MNKPTSLEILETIAAEMAREHRLTIDEARTVVRLGIRDLMVRMGEMSAEDAADSFFAVTP